MLRRRRVIIKKKTNDDPQPSGHKRCVHGSGRNKQFMDASNQMETWSWLNENETPRNAQGMEPLHNFQEA